MINNMAAKPSAKYRFSIDRGGTFTDVFGETPDGRIVVLKLLSEDPLNYPDAPREAIRRILTSVREDNSIIFLMVFLC